MYILGYYHAFLLSTAGVDGLGVVISNISTPVLHRRKACFGRYFRPSSGAYKTVCAALGIAFLLSTAGADGLEVFGSNPSTPAVDSRKA